MVAAPKVSVRQALIHSVAFKEFLMVERSQRFAHVRESCPTDRPTGRQCGVPKVIRLISDGFGPEARREKEAAAALQRRRATQANLSVALFLVKSSSALKVRFSIMSVGIPLFRALFTPITTSFSSASEPEFKPLNSEGDMAPFFVIIDSNGAEFSTRDLQGNLASIAAWVHKSTLIKKKTGVTLTDHPRQFPPHYRATCAARSIATTQARSKRSAFITLVQAATKSLTNLPAASLSA